jgi:hypothetical protein
VFTGWLDKLGKSNRGATLVGRYQDFDRLFEQLLAVNAAKNVRNTAVALRLMAELAGEALAREETADARA